VPDTTGGRQVVSELAARYPAVVKAWVGSGYKRSVIQTGAAHGIDIQVDSKDPGQPRTLEPTPRLTSTQSSAPRSPTRRATPAHPRARKPE
jgi:hypothetical protein